MCVPNAATSTPPLILSNKVSRPSPRALSQPRTAEGPTVSTASRTRPSTSLFQSHCHKGSLGCPRGPRKYALGGLSSAKRKKTPPWRGTPWRWTSTTIPPRACHTWLVFGSVHLVHLHSLPPLPLFPWSHTLNRFPMNYLRSSVFVSVLNPHFRFALEIPLDFLIPSIDYFSPSVHPPPH